MATLLAISTAFMTVSISSPVPDWLSVGNFDPVIAFVLADTALAAEGRAPRLSKLAQDLLQRSLRFFDQGVRMQPRGQRIPWWEVPRLPPDLVAVENGTASIRLPGVANSTATDTVTAKRKRRTV